MLLHVRWFCLLYLDFYTVQNAITERAHVIRLEPVDIIVEGSKPATDAAQSSSQLMLWNAVVGVSDRR